MYAALLRRKRESASSKLISSRSNNMSAQPLWDSQDPRRPSVLSSEDGLKENNPSPPSSPSLLHHQNDSSVSAPSKSSTSSSLSSDSSKDSVSDVSVFSTQDLLKEKTPSSPSSPSLLDQREDSRVSVPSKSSLSSSLSSDSNKDSASEVSQKHSDGGSGSSTDEVILIDDSGYNDSLSLLDATANKTQKHPKVETNDFESVSKALEARSLSLVAEAKAAEAAAAAAKAESSKLDPLIESSGLDPRIQADLLRQKMAEKGYIEMIDENVFPISQEGFEFEIFSCKRTENPFTPKYISGKAFALDPKHIDVTVKRMKVEESGRSEKKRSSVEEVEGEEGPRMTSDEGSSKKNEKDTSPVLKKKRKRKLKICPKYVDVSISSPTLTKDQEPEMATKMFQHYFLNEERSKAFICELPYLHPKGSLVFSDDTSKEAIKSRKNLIEGIKKSIPNEDQEGIKKQLLGVMCDNPEAFFQTKRLVGCLKRSGYSDPNHISRLISFDEDLGRAVIIAPEDASPCEEIPEEVSSMLRDDFHSQGLAHSRLATNLKSFLSEAASPFMASTPCKNSSIFPFLAESSPEAENFSANGSFSSLSPRRRATPDPMQVDSRSPWKSVEREIGKVREEADVEER